VWQWRGQKEGVARRLKKHRHLNAGSNLRGIDVGVEPNATCQQYWRAEGEAGSISRGVEGRNVFVVRTDALKTKRAHTLPVGSETTEGGHACAVSGHVCSDPFAAQIDRRG
jgi:hypothetical protein